MQVIETVARYEKCSRPLPPELRPLLPGQHFGSPENAERLTGNVLTLEKQLRDLNAALDCYEAQAEGN